MALADISGVARLTADPELRFTPAGKARASVSLAFNQRRFNQDSQQWEDGSTFFVRGTLWEQFAENVADTLSKGMEVVVTGRIKTAQWADRETGEKRSAPELEVFGIGPNLKWASADVKKVERRASGSAQGGSEQDPWGSAPLEGGNGAVGANQGGFGGGGRVVDDQPPF